MISKTHYTQNGIDCTVTIVNVSIAVPMQSERFYPVIEHIDTLSVAENLQELYGTSGELLIAMAKQVSIAEIGGYLFFEDGSELSISYFSTN